MYCGFNRSGDEQQPDIPTEVKVQAALLAQHPGGAIGSDFWRWFAAQCRGLTPAWLITIQRIFNKGILRNRTPIFEPWHLISHAASVEVILNFLAGIARQEKPRWRIQYPDHIFSAAGSGEWGRFLLPAACWANSIRYSKAAFFRLHLSVTGNTGCRWCCLSIQRWRFVNRHQA